MYSNNIVNFQESTPIWNACTKNLESYWMHHVQPGKEEKTINQQLYPSKVKEATNSKLSVKLRLDMRL